MYQSTIDMAGAHPLTAARRDRRGWLAALAIAVATVALRFGQIGNPIAGLDEQFYLLVGDRMWSGAIPYVDIWDRKPAGLFLLFAAIRLLPGDGVVAAQVVATMFVAATAWLIALIARRWTGWTPAAMAGIFYVAAAGELWMETTQTPAFFNLAVAGAALLTLRALDDPARIARHGTLAMLLCGAAIQIKTNAVFPGLYFGAWLLWAEWRRTRATARVLRLAAAFAVAGSAATLGIFAWYAAIGHLDAWWQANVLSVLAKGRPGDPAAIGSLKGTLVIGFPVLALAAWGLRERIRSAPPRDRDRGFVLGWMAVGIVDFASIGGYFPHYAIPFLLAATPLIADAFATRRVGAPLFALVMAWPAVHTLWLNPRVTEKERAYARTVVAALPADVRTRCLFIYEGPVAYYHLARACTVTRFPFTAHLSSAREAPSLGVDPAGELDAIVARAPGTILTVAGSRWSDRNPAMERRLARHLARRYRLERLLPYRLNPDDGRLAMWRRREP